MQRKDREREEARRLRTEGWSVKRIAKELGVSASSVSVWVRDIPPPPRPTKVRKAGRPSGPSPVSIRVEPGDPSKGCPRCERILPLAAFSRDGDGHQHWCRDCFRDYFRARGDHHREQSAAAHRRRREAARALVLERLKGDSCVDCGEDELLVLEFDHHLGEKTANVATLLADGRRLDVVRAELERCEVVCVNCHRRRTARRAGTYRASGVPPVSWTGPQRRNQDHLIETLRRSGCVDCGEHDPIVLEFDHRADKRAAVVRLAGGCSLRTLELEIAKCDVRCANCHRLRTLATATCWREDDHWAVGLLDPHA